MTAALFRKSAAILALLAGAAIAVPAHAQSAAAQSTTAEGKKLAFDRSKGNCLTCHVIKGGVLVVEEGQLRRAPTGRRLRVRPGYDPAVTRDLKRWFDGYACVSFENYPAVELGE